MGLYRRNKRELKPPPGRPANVVGPRITNRVKLDDWLTKGLWASVRSTWCARIMYVAAEETLVVRFRKGYTAAYPNTGPEFATQIYQAASKGKFVRHTMRGKPYHEWQG